MKDADAPIIVSETRDQTLNTLPFCDKQKPQHTAPDLLLF